MFCKASDHPPWEADIFFFFWTLDPYSLSTDEEPFTCLIVIGFSATEEFIGARYRVDHALASVDDVELSI